MVTVSARSSSSAKRRGRLEHVLGVVDHEQHRRRVRDPLDDLVEPADARALLHSERRGDGTRDEPALREPREVDEVGATGEVVEGAGRDLEREARLPDTARAG